MYYMVFLHHFFLKKILDKKGFLIPKIGQIMQHFAQSFSPGINLLFQIPTAIISLWWLLIVSNAPRKCTFTPIISISRKKELNISYLSPSNCMRNTAWIKHRVTAIHSHAPLHPTKGSERATKLSFIMYTKRLNSKQRSH